MACVADCAGESGVTISTIGLDVAGIADLVRESRARGVPRRIVARGHWLDAGWPCRATERLDLSALDGIVSYEPGDLTLTARAGTPLAEIERVTAGEGQWLTLDPYGSAGGSIGATIATASAGPLASAYGTPRDHVLGCEFITGAGDVVRAGGRVVKNVAGFDLVRLVTGAWGTLGALTEMTVRLRARPEVDVSFFVRVAGATTPEAMATAAWRWTRETNYRPLAAELLSPSLARALGAGSDAQLLVRLAGNAAFVRAARDSLGALGDPGEHATDAWQALRTAEPEHAMVFRASTLPAKLGPVFAKASALADALGGYAHATLSRGVVRCVIPAGGNEGDSDTIAPALLEIASLATIVGERLPAPLWLMLSRATDAAPLAERIRRAFDPAGVLNPGLLGAT